MVLEVPAGRADLADPEDRADPADRAGRADPAGRAGRSGRRFPGLHSGLRSGRHSSGLRLWCLSSHSPVRYFRLSRGATATGLTGSAGAASATAGAATASGGASSSAARSRSRAVLRMVRLTGRAAGADRRVTAAGTTSDTPRRQYKSDIKYKIDGLVLPSRLSIPEKAI